MDGPQRELLAVSSRGQITVPAAMRMHLGIAPGGAVIVEEIDGESRLKPAEVLEVDLYSDAQIETWDRANVLTTRKTDSIVKRLQQG